MIPIEFSKYHGTGNDFIVVNDWNRKLQPTREEIAGLCRRHFGIGADGFILVEPSEEADVKMVYFNADGSPAVMCGNGIRCFAKYVFDHGLVDTRRFDVETAAGIKHIEIIDDGKSTANRIRVDMGAPIFDKDRIGVEMNVDPVLDQTLDTTMGPVLFSAVSMGNPHAIIEVADVENHPVLNWGLWWRPILFLPMAPM
ncbi:diaminopimelate epimerase [Alkalibacter rhizosphaerae]|uniref:Diaminopimelate epimerase n=1 Tax=Alkalibacter rhizosphaerae TaxID=2815577 RepID=A0A975AIJ8_9FIRM|nr:diaminopimelate epimerase [Alkalibacter rhizosphaerae]QSX08754.1 diaminopimelate epimerase [Alkalibacter rhizosphaerae]